MSKGTPVRTVRVPTSIWDAAKAKAERDGTTLTAVIVAALEKFLR